MQHVEQLMMPEKVGATVEDVFDLSRQSFGIVGGAHQDGKFLLPCGW